MLVTLLIGAFFLSFLGTGYLRKYAVTKQLIDIPNHRSSHSIPTPKGGGLAFVLSFLVSIPILRYLNVINSSFAFSAGLSAAAIAVLGLWDDRYQIAAKHRLLIHFLISSLAVYYSGGIDSLTVFSWSISSSWLLSLFAVFFLVWLLNLYNFMDGIDGLAGMEAVFVCGAAALLYYVNGKENMMYLPLALALPVTGFLFWNLPRAKIFMGDVGSGFLGFLLGMMSIHATSINVHFFWAWIILLGVFIVDATVTLCFRAWSAQKISEAHCNHAYQHAARQFSSHCIVTSGILAINLLWLLPCALLVSMGTISGLSGVIIAYIPLCGLAVKFHAGKNLEFSHKTHNPLHSPGSMRPRL